MKKITVLLAVFCSVLSLQPVYAAEDVDPADKPIRESLKNFMPNPAEAIIAPSPIAGIYEVIMGAQLFYASADGKYLINGRIYDAKTKADVSSPRLNAIRKDAVSAEVAKGSIVFKPEKTKYAVTVFTDIDCGYCRKLHTEMDQYMAEGIEIHYLFMPRAGYKSRSYQKAVNVWCADDRNAALTDAKNGKSVPEKECENPVKAHFDLAQSVGVNGTPAIVAANGDMIPGYVPAAQLVERLKAMGQ